MKKKALYIAFLYQIMFWTFAIPVYADSPDVAKIQNFLQSIIQVLSTISGFIAVVFFVLGGIGYITSSGNPEKLNRSKNTILYSGFGLAVTIGAFVLSKIVTDLATTAFGK